MTSSSDALSSLAEAMRERIRSGVWVAGERIPSERELRQEFQVSLPLLRRALLKLRREGLITGGDGSVPQVDRVVPSRPLHDGVVSFSQWARGAGLRPGQRIISVEERTVSLSVAPLLGVAPSDLVVEVVRLRTLDNTPAVMERAQFPFPVGAHLLHTPFTELGVHELLERSGISITRVRHTLDAVPAHPLDAEYLHVDPGVPLLRTKRVSYTADGTVCEVVDERYLPHVATLMTETRVRAHGAVTGDERSA